MLKFEIYRGGNLLETKELSSLPIKIGKLATSQLCIDGQGVGRTHAMIDNAGGVYSLIDLGSTSGSYVNGQRITKQVLKPGDRLGFGDVEVVVQFEQAAVAVPSFGAGVAAGLIANAGVGARVKKRRKENTFERRFLSDRYRGGDPVLEIAVLWMGEVVSVKQYKCKSNAVISIGADARSTYSIQDEKVGLIRPLVRSTGSDSWELLFTDWMNGFLLVNPESNNGIEKISLSDAITQGIARKASVGLGGGKGALDQEISRRAGESFAVDLKGDTRMKLVIGDVSILVHYVSNVNFVLPFGFTGAAGVSMLYLLVSLGVSLVLHGTFALMVLFTTDRVDLLTIDKLLTSSRFAEALISPEEEEKEKQEEEENEEEEAPDEEAGAKAAEEEGKTGKPDETETEGKFAIEGNADSMALSKEQNTQAAMGAGLLASANEMSSLLGTAFQAQGYDAVDAWGNFDSSAAMGNVAGNYGLGMAGAGRGGGGTNMGGFGTGRFGTAGRGGGLGGGGREYGSGVANLGEKGKAEPKVKVGAADVSGGLDKRIIRRVVNQHRNELRACYEKELAKTKGLNGKIMIRWIIDAQGSVVKAIVTETTMNNKAVESCLVNSVKYWRFPAPRGGTLVQVDFPFVFEVGG